MIKATIDAFGEAGLRDKVKIIIGGAPLTELYAQPNRRGWIFSGCKPRSCAGEGTAPTISLKPKDPQC